jgi:NitT/TauT family transport system permease protein
MTTSITQNKTFQRLKKPLAFFLSAIFWLGVWEIVYLIVGSDVIIASPIGTFKRVFELSTQGQFWLCVGNSLLNVIIGFSLAVVLSTPFLTLPQKQRKSVWSFFTKHTFLKASLFGKPSLIWNG